MNLFKGILSISLAFFFHWSRKNISDRVVSVGINYSGFDYANFYDHIIGCKCEVEIPKSILQTLRLKPEKPEIAKNKKTVSEKPEIT